MVLGAVDAGHRHLAVVAPLADGQLRLAAGAGEVVVGGGQLERRALHDDGLAADGTDVSDGSFFLGHKRALLNLKII